MDTHTARRGPAGARASGGTRAAARGRDGKSGRVLIADDDAAVRLLCTVNLKAEGLHVLEAEDGLDALAQACSEQPDLILTDVNMPGLDGFALAERLRRDERTRRIPLVFVTGEVGHANAERARTLGALAFLAKPFDPCALAAFVARELAAARAAAGLTAAVASEPG